MLHARPYINESSPVIGSVECKDHYAVLGQFSAVDDTRPRARQMARRLVLNDGTVTTVATAPTPAQIALRFRSRRYWRQTLQALDAVTAKSFFVILYPDGLGFDEINKPHWWQRRIEEWRRIQFRCDDHAQVQVLFFGD